MAHRESLPTLFDAVFNAQSVAVVGASNNPDKVGGRPIHYLQRFGYQGVIYPVNPRRSVVQGLKAYPSVSALPTPVELAVIVVGKSHVMAAVQACADQGVNTAVILSSGFGELDAQGKTMQQGLLELAQQYGMRLIGPNSQGVANFRNGLVTNFSSMLKQEVPADGPVAIVSQSGATSGVLYTLVRKRGLGVRYLLATGNEADITTAELALATLQDPDVRLLLLYTENLGDADNWRLLGEAAHRKGVPVLVVKAGRTRHGAQTAQSHTGALVSEDGVVDAFFAHCGIWRCHDLEMLADTAQLYLDRWSQPLGDVILISNSGAACVMATDAAVLSGLPLASLDADVISDLHTLIPGTVNCHNPIDLTTAIMTDSGLVAKVLGCLGRRRHDLILFSLPVAGEGYDLERIAKDLRTHQSQTQATVLVTGTVAAIRDPFAEQGLAVLNSEHRAIEVFTQFFRHKALLASRTQETVVSRAPEAITIPRQPRYNEAESLAVLKAVGLPVVSYHVCHSMEAVMTAWQELATPLVLKGLSQDLPHKSEHGLVFLGLEDAQAVRNAYEACRSKLAALDVAWEGVLVAPQVRAPLEVAIGLKQDPVFGPVLLVGAGGKYVEAMPDFQLLMAPASRAEIRQAFLGLRVAPRFAGLRGEPALALDALVEVVHTFSAAAPVLLQHLDAIDINPVMVGSAPNDIWIR